MKKKVQHIRENDVQKLPNLKLVPISGYLKQTKETNNYRGEGEFYKQKNTWVRQLIVHNNF